MISGEWLFDKHILALYMNEDNLSFSIKLTISLMSQTLWLFYDNQLNG